MKFFDRKHQNRKRSVWRILKALQRLSEVDLSEENEGDLEEIIEKVWELKKNVEGEELYFLSKKEEEDLEERIYSKSLP